MSSRLLCQFLVLVAFWCTLSMLSVDAQSTPTPKFNCSNATAMPNINLTEIAGTWYEVLRQPANDMQCIKLNLTNYPNNILNIQLTFANNANSLNVNQTMSGNLTYDASNTNGYNVTFTLGQQSKTPEWIKPLYTNYVNTTLVCGYTNASDPTTVFTAILTRERTPANLTYYNAEANKNYTDFTNMTTLYQSAKCYTSSASSTLPVLSTFFALLYAVLKYFN